jgi:hypothetical protein
MGVIVSNRMPSMNPRGSVNTPVVRRLTQLDTVAAELPEWADSIVGAGAITPG